MSLCALLIFVFHLEQISMNARQATEAVNTHVPTHQGHESVAAGLDSHWLVMADVKVG